MQRKTRLAKFLDLFTLFILIFILFFAITTKFITKSLIAISLTLFLTILVFATLVKEINKKQQRKILTMKEETRLQKTLNALKFGDPSKIRKFLINALTKKYETTNYRNYILIKLDDKKAILIYDFSQDELQLKTLQSKLENIPNNIKTYVLAPSFSQDVLIYSKNIKYLKLMGSQETYLLLKELNAFPIIKQENIKTSTKSKFFNSINRKNTLKFLRYGLLLLAVSLIIPYSTYYRIFAYILFVLSAISLFRPIRQIIQPYNGLL